MAWATVAASRMEEAAAENGATRSRRLTQRAVRRLPEPAARRKANSGSSFSNSFPSGRAAVPLPAPSQTLLCREWVLHCVAPPREGPVGCRLVFLARQRVVIWCFFVLLGGVAVLGWLLVATGPLQKCELLEQPRLLRRVFRAARVGVLPLFKRLFLGLLKLLDRGRGRKIHGRLRLVLLRKESLFWEVLAFRSLRRRRARGGPSQSSSESSSWACTDRRRRWRSLSPRFILESGNCLCLWAAAGPSHVLLLFRRRVLAL